ncbi:hypothetical protein AO367_0129 [Moraxella catarrhalis]|nr:hypothetical protein AO380_1597 [Moraxella catarrhalis]OAV32144.1 hypothetical protein AO367_0129 [Moraxella catarrhalis]
MCFGFKWYFVNDVMTITKKNQARSYWLGFMTIKIVLSYLDLL